MNKYQEELHRLAHSLENDLEWNEEEILQELVDKETPMKPNGNKKVGLKC